MGVATKLSNQSALQHWCHERRDKFGNDTGQALPLKLSVYQEDIIAISIEQHAARDIEKSLLEVLPKWYGVQLRTIYEVKHPFEATVDVIGAH